MRERLVDRRFLPIVLALLLMFSPLAAAQEDPTEGETQNGGETADAGPQQVTIDLEAVQEGSAFYFRFPGETQRNPTLNVPAGAEVTVNLVSVSGFHNIHVEGFEPSEYVSDGQSTTYTFTAPESGTLPYWCDPHKSAGMVGQVAVGAAGGDAGAAAPAEAPTEYTLEAVQEGSSFYFRIPGETARNPTLYVKPESEITITLIGVSGLHNIHVEGFDASEYVNVDDTITYTFTSPAEGERLAYWCDPHRSSGMQGQIVSGAPAAAGGGGGGAEGPEVNGPAVDLGSLGFSDCAGFMIPASTARGEVGGPTVADYVERCRSGGDGGVSTQGVDSHPADYIIPVTWALIALGVVGVFWVNRYYKP